MIFIMNKAVLMEDSNHKLMDITPQMEKFLIILMKMGKIPFDHQHHIINSRQV